LQLYKLVAQMSEIAVVGIPAADRVKKLGWVPWKFSVARWQKNE
jgi:hypothetical protein